MTHRAWRPRRALWVAIGGKTSNADPDESFRGRMPSAHAPPSPGGFGAKGEMRGPLNVVLAIDSFKGCATSSQVEMWLAEGMRRAGDDVRVAEIPVADGGEGHRRGPAALARRRGAQRM